MVFRLVDKEVLHVLIQNLKGDIDVALGRYIPASVDKLRSECKEMLQKYSEKAKVEKQQLKKGMFGSFFAPFCGNETRVAQMEFFQQLESILKGDDEGVKQILIGALLYRMKRLEVDQSGFTAASDVGEIKSYSLVSQALGLDKTNDPRLDALTWRSCLIAFREYISREEVKASLTYLRNKSFFDECIRHVNKYIDLETFQEVDFSKTIAQSMQDNRQQKTVPAKALAEQYSQLYQPYELLLSLSNNIKEIEKKIGPIFHAMVSKSSKISVDEAWIVYAQANISEIFFKDSPEEEAFLKLMLQKCWLNGFTLQEDSIDKLITSISMANYFTIYGGIYFFANQSDPRFNRISPLVTSLLDGADNTKLDLHGCEKDKLFVKTSIMAFWEYLDKADLEDKHFSLWNSKANLAGNVKLMYQSFLSTAPAPDAASAAYTT